MVVVATDFQTGEGMELFGNVTDPYDSAVFEHVRQRFQEKKRLTSMERQGRTYRPKGCGDHPKGGLFM